MKKLSVIVASVLLASVSVFADGEKNYGGGKPWINSMIKSNVVNSQRPSPKDDFHLYVNYDWLVKSEIPEGKSDFNSFSEVEDKTEKNIIEVLTNPKIPGQDAENVRSLYKAILDWKARNELGAAPLLSVIEEIKKISTIDELSDFIVSPEKTFLVPTFISIGNTTKFDDSSSYIATVSMDGFYLDDAAEYKKRTEIGDRYYKASLYATKAMLPRVGYSEAEAEKMLNDVLKLETILAKKAYTAADINSPDYYKKINNVVTPKKFASLAPKFPLMRFVSSRGYGEAKEFMVCSPKCFSDLNKIYNQKNLELIKNYMIVKTANNYASYLDAQAYDVAVNVENIISGSTGKIPDQKMAVDSVKVMLETPLARAYLSRYDLSNLKKQITEICTSLIAIYRQMLQEEDWISSQTKQKAIEKLDNIRINAVYPEKWIDYSGLKLNGLSFFECIKAISSYNRKLNAAHTNGKVDKELWSTENLLIANAFYDPTENSINIIPGLLEEPFYYEGMSQEALLGGIGVVIGHEISHAFDTMGAQFDKDGNFVNWWTKADLAAFQKRAEKLIKYYDGISSWDGLQIKGEVIQTEAIADMAGTKAMLKYAESIPDFNYKKFFEAYATVWRRIWTPELDEYRTFNDPHPKHHLRTNVTIQQFDEFYKAYDIKPGDKMYLAPEDRILVW